MININELDDYFMKPYYLENIGNVYPVKISKYEKFKTLASKYIIQGKDTLHNIYKVDGEINLLDYFVDMGLKGDFEVTQLKSLIDYEPENDEEAKKVKNMLTIYKLFENGDAVFYSIQELEELFSIVLNKQVIFTQLSDDKYYFFINGTDFKIDNNNFETFREVIMWQNILFEPPTSPSKYGNEAIQMAIKNEFGDSTSSLASICSVVSCNSGVSDIELQEYTYYRLMYDFSIINRTHGNIFSFMLRSQGCNEAMINNLSESVNLHTNPYECIFKKFKNNAGKL